MVRTVVPMMVTTLVITASALSAAASAAPQVRPNLVGSPPSAASGSADPLSRAVGATSIGTALAAGTLNPAQAVAQARTEASANGITDFVSVTDAHTGAVLAQTGNAGSQVASESIVKLMIAAYYLILVGGYTHQSPSVLSQLSYMIRFSDDATASAYFTSAAVPTIAARYGMGSTINATDRVGHWGAVRITAHDMTTFLFRAMHDPEVGPWLHPVMAQVAPLGSDGFDQHFGMNSLTGVHGSKQGWGGDQFWTAARNVINSVGYTDLYYVAILQNSFSYPDPARATSSFAARTIAAARIPVAKPAPPAVNGDFIRLAGSAAVYRLAGGAPVYVSSWTPFGGVQPFKLLSSAQWKALRAQPADGTFITATTGQVYRMAGGAPIYVSSWTPFDGPKPAVRVSVSAVTNGGRPGVWSHLALRPADGTFIVATGSNQVFRVVAGTPIYVSNWAHFGGGQARTVIGASAISQAGKPGVWSHLRSVMPDGTFVRSTGTNAVFRIAGGAPVYITSWSPLGGGRPAQSVDETSIINAGKAGQWSHMRFYPADGTFLEGLPGGRIYRVSGGHATYVPSWKPYGGPKPSVAITQTTIDRAGSGGFFNHLR